MKKPLFTGVCTALVTPFLGNAVNYPLLELLLGRQIAAGIEAVVLCGTTGESPTLSDCEKLEIFRRHRLQRHPARRGSECGSGSSRSGCVAGGKPLLQQSHCRWTSDPL